MKVSRDYLKYKSRAIRRENMAKKCLKEKVESILLT
jgi:hypothetical protein